MTETVKHDFRYVKIDETEYWNEDFVAKLGPGAKLIATYIFDANEQTYCQERLLEAAKNLTLDPLRNEKINPGNMFLGADENDKVHFLVCDKVTDDSVCHEEMRFPTSKCMKVRLKALSKCGKYTTKIIGNITAPLWGLILRWECEHCGEKFLTR